MNHINERVISDDDKKEILSANVQEVARINLILLGETALINKEPYLNRKADDIKKIKSHARYWRSAIRNFIKDSDIQHNIKIRMYLYECGMLNTLNALKTKHLEKMKICYTYIYKNGLQYLIPYDLKFYK